MVSNTEVVQSPGLREPTPAEIAAQAAVMAAHLGIASGEPYVNPATAPEDQVEATYADAYGVPIVGEYRPVTG